MAPMSILDGRYRLAERLGAGGMSVVWRAHDQVLDRPVAVKLLSARYAADAASRRLIRDEARAAARLTNPHICRVYDYGESRTGAGDRVPYLVLELLTGATLAERLRAGPLPARDALRVGVQVASALATAHSGGLVHRDIKPANVMLTPAGAKVVDFGIAAAAGDSTAPESEGGLVGTPGYVAPERLTGGKVRAASDVYGLGLLLYLSLTGNLPWRTETVSRALAAGTYVEPASLPPVSGLPREVTTLVRRCLAKNPDQRPTAYAAAQQLAEAGGWRLASAGSGTVAELDEAWSAAEAIHVRAGRESMPDGADGAGEDGDAPATVWLRTTGPRRRRLDKTVAVVTTAALVAVGAVGVVAAVDRWQAYGDLDASAFPPVIDLQLPNVPLPALPVPDLRRVEPDGPDPGLPAVVDTPGSVDSDGDGGEEPATEPARGPGGSSGSGGSDPAGGGDADAGGSGTGGSGTGEPESATGEPEPEPRPEPEPEPAPSPVDVAPVPVVREVSTLLGTLVVQCVGSTASLVSADLLPGVGLVQTGSGAELGIELDLLLTRVSVTVQCQAGEPAVAIGVG